MEFLRQLTVRQAVIITGVVLALILIGIIITSTGGGERDPLAATNTPSLSFDALSTPITPDDESP